MCVRVVVMVGWCDVCVCVVVMIGWCYVVIMLAWSWSFDVTDSGDDIGDEEVKKVVVW